MSASDDFKHANGAPVQPGSAVAVPTPKTNCASFAQAGTQRQVEHVLSESRAVEICSRIKAYLRARLLDQDHEAQP
jgi:hypothetical protein